MATLHSIRIKNFRGIKEFEQKFKNGLICIIGRGDSGKSTVLDAIAYVLSSSWNINFYDSDFYNCQIEYPIEIEATLKNLPDTVLAKYKLYVRGITKDETIIDDMEIDDAHDADTAITIRLTVTKELEPKWEVISYRGQEPLVISANDRVKLNTFTISDYSDKHFSLNKGNSLYSLHKRLEEIVEDEENIILDILRQAKTDIDNGISTKFENVIKEIKNVSSKLGVSIGNLSATVDYRDMFFKENKVCLHEESIPLRLKGKGTKKIISLAIQIAVANPNGIILIDEIEQGLEPDRVKHVVSILKDCANFQIFFTTHSRDVIVELTTADLFIMKKGAKRFLSVEPELQGCVRKNPEAFFAKRIIVCEGATEIGICRALNNYLEKKGEKSLAYLGIVLADGTGSNMIQYTKEFKSLGFDVCLLCDSDDKAINDQKFELNEVKIIHCKDGYAIEQQLFTDLPYESVIKMIEHLIENNFVDSHSMYDNIYAKQDNKPPYSIDWYKNEITNIRHLLGNNAKKNGWYKKIDSGENIGEILFDVFDTLDETKKIKQMFQELINWIGKEHA